MAQQLDRIGIGIDFFISAKNLFKLNSKIITCMNYNFKNTMGDSLYGNSFFKNDDRQHFGRSTLENWAEFKDDFSKLG